MSDRWASHQLLTAKSRAAAVRSPSHRHNTSYLRGLIGTWSVRDRLNDTKTNSLYRAWTWHYRSARLCLGGSDAALRTEAPQHRRFSGRAFKTVIGTALKLSVLKVLTGNCNFSHPGWLHSAQTCQAKKKTALASWSRPFEPDDSMSSTEVRIYNRASSWLHRMLLNARASVTRSSCSCSPVDHQAHRDSWFWTEFTLPPKPRDSQTLASGTINKTSHCLPRLCPTWKTIYVSFSLVQKCLFTAVTSCSYSNNQPYLLSTE